MNRIILLINMYLDKVDGKFMMNDFREFVCKNVY